MAIQFACPACKCVLTVPENATGAKFACSQCGQRVQAPGSTGSQGAPANPVTGEDRVPLCYVAAEICAGLLAFLGWVAALYYGTEGLSLSPRPGSGLLLIMSALCAIGSTLGLTLVLTFVDLARHLRK